MLDKAIETRGHTGRDGMLKLSVSTGLPDADVTVVVRITPLAPVNGVDANGWPIGFFERIAGSMPDLERPCQGNFEERLPLA
jgi:hypothetical protein